MPWLSASLQRLNPGKRYHLALPPHHVLCKWPCRNMPHPYIWPGAGASAWIWMYRQDNPVLASRGPPVQKLGPTPPSVWDTARWQETVATTAIQKQSACVLKLPSCFEAARPQFSKGSEENAARDSPLRQRFCSHCSEQSWEGYETQCCRIFRQQGLGRDNHSIASLCRNKISVL